ncbi:MAG: hypothetical protein F6J94_14450 [Moorea sp. SIO1F2]|uniref:hypothetical protein n=1 Tax=Moorena sp. SIO1F2 TaxID=2607819 RepID=UPI0013BDCA43|nr:hypothetical protein [Moorena sp. SIO1F2]NET83079.1 hypothetical protein [Moorena sp. SIO1F2]
MGNGEWGMGNGEWGMGIGDKLSRHSNLSSTFHKLLYPVLGKLFSAIANPKLCDR